MQINQFKKELSKIENLLNSVSIQFCYGENAINFTFLKSFYFELKIAEKKYNNFSVIRVFKDGKPIPVNTFEQLKREIENGANWACFSAEIITNDLAESISSDGFLD